MQGEREEAGRRIREVRQANGWGRRETARAIGVDPETLWRWERGKLPQHNKLPLIRAWLANPQVAVPMRKPGPVPALQPTVRQAIRRALDLLASDEDSDRAEARGILAGLLAAMPPEGART